MCLQKTSWVVTPEVAKMHWDSRTGFDKNSTPIEEGFQVLRGEEESGRNKRMADWRLSAPLVEAEILSKRNHYKALEYENAIVPRNTQLARPPSTPASSAVRSKSCAKSTGRPRRRPITARALPTGCSGPRTLSW